MGIKGIEHLSGGDPEEEPLPEAEEPKKFPWEELLPPTEEK